jgi:hypothetical protein
MSLCITVVMAEGVAVAGESRQTQVFNGVNRIGSDNAAKVFELTPTILASTAGWAFLKRQGNQLSRNVASHVEDFKPTIPAAATVLETAVLMWEFFSTLYQEHIAALPAQAVAAGGTALNFTVSGYTAQSRTGEVYPFTIPSANPPQHPARTSDNPGPYWIGTTDVVARIVNGYDFRALELPFVQAANQNNNAGTTALNGLGYVIPWPGMTLQDAIDFAVEMIRVTIIVQRFTAGTVNQMGSTLNVGGPIDVAVVRPGGTVQWITRKELHT